MAKLLATSVLLLLLFSTVAQGGPAKGSIRKTPTLVQMEWSCWCPCLNDVIISFIWHWSRARWSPRWQEEAVWQGALWWRQAQCRVWPWSIPGQGAGKDIQWAVTWRSKEKARVSTSFISRLLESLFFHYHFCFWRCLVKGHLKKWII